MKSYSKRYFVMKVFPALLILFFVMTGIIKVDLINTQCLSPLGNTNENYELISREFGSDFSNFIKDNSFLKIYKEQNSILVKVGNEDFRINNKSDFIEKAQDLFESIGNKIDGVRKTVNKVV